VRVSARDPPSGVVTFLFTDIEGSTRRWEADAAAMRSALLAHDEVLRTAIDVHGGFLFSHTGDGVVAAFASPKAPPSMPRSLRNEHLSCRWRGRRPSKLRNRCGAPDSVGIVASTPGRCLPSWPSNAEPAQRDDRDNDQEQIPESAGCQQS